MTLSPELSLRNSKTDTDIPEIETAVFYRNVSSTPYFKETVLDSKDNDQDSMFKENVKNSNLMKDTA